LDHEFQVNEAPENEFPAGIEFPLDDDFLLAVFNRDRGGIHGDLLNYYSIKYYYAFPAAPNRFEDLHSAAQRPVIG